MRKEAELEWGDVRETPSAIADFKDGRGPRAKKCGQILEAEMDRKQSPLEARQRNTALQTFHSSENHFEPLTSRTER